MVYFYLVDDVIEEMRLKIVGNFVAKVTIEYSKETEFVITDLLELGNSIVFHVMERFALHQVKSMGYVLRHLALSFTRVRYGRI